jgi:hypothetical protein
MFDVHHDRRVEKSVSNCLIRLAFTPALLLAAAVAQAKPIVVETAPARAAAMPAACSFRRPICVRGALDVGVLDALERAWEAGIVLGVPLPASYDAYVVDEASRSAIREREILPHRDRTRAFSIIDSRVAAGCSRDFEAARELFAASALSSTPAIDDGTLRAETTALAKLAVPCAAVDTAVFQAHPNRALVDRHVGAKYDEGSSLFFSWVDAAFGKEPGHFITATWAFAETKTPLPETSADWAAEPDVFDVVRESLKDAIHSGSTLDDALVHFAIARAMSPSERIRNAIVFEPAPLVDWDIAWPAAARTLSSPEGIAETGAAYVRVDTKGRKPNTRFRIDATWEEHAKLRWVVVKVDAQNHEIARYEAVAAPKATEAHLQVVDLDDASALVVVATNVGNWKTPYDPDEDVQEPHGWLLTLASE